MDIPSKADHSTEPFVQVRYRRRVVNNVGIFYREAGGRGTVVLPTGTGKTHLANLCIERAGRPTLVITPTIDLMNQWYDELVLSFGVEVGLLGGGYYDIRPLTVTTYDSAYMNMDRIGDKFGLIVFDECHHLPGPTYGLAATCALASIGNARGNFTKLGGRKSHLPRERLAMDE